MERQGRGTLGSGGLAVENTRFPSAGEGIPSLYRRMPPVPSGAKPGGGDGFLFRPLRIPFLSVVRLWSPFATASGSVALADAPYLLCYMYICYVIVVVPPLIG